MPNIVECQLCDRHCRLQQGEYGDCRVRINLDGKLYSLVYGKPCAAHIDPIEKKPLYHVLPTSKSFSIATAGCNLHCKFCQNWQISQRGPQETENYDMPPDKVVEYAMKHGCRSIAYTYSEPVVFYEYMLDTAKVAHKHGIINIFRTAAHIKEEPLLELCPVIQTASVDLKGITEEYYQRMCSSTLAPVLQALEIMKKHGVWIEITNLIIPTWNDRDEDIRPLCRWILDHLGPDVPLHFSRFWPMHQLKNLPPTPEGSLSRAREIAFEEGIHYPYVGNIPSHEGNNTYCPHDQKLLIKRIGYEVLENNIVNGSCKFCGTNIPGIWSL